MDGRDVPPSSGKDYLLQLEEELRKVGTGKIATVSGRYYAMDRDKRWDRVEKAYNAIMLGKGNKAASAEECMDNSYAAGVVDEFVIPTVITDEDGQPVAKAEENDSFIFFNFRPDRAREITRAIVDPDFDGFEREKVLKSFVYICFTRYDDTLPNVSIAFKPQKLDNTLGEYISSLGLKQLRTAETEKYAHVTFFFNGGVEEPNPGEDRILIPSPKVATYDLKPEMSAYEVCDVLVENILSKKYDLIIVDSTDPFGPGEGLFTKEFYGNCSKALTDQGILINQHESTYYDSYVDMVKRTHRRIGSAFPVSMVYQTHIPTYPSGHWLFGFASKNLHPIYDLKADEWKKFGMKTRYYNTELHKGCFALPNYVLDVLEDCD